MHSILLVEDNQELQKTILRSLGELCAVSAAGTIAEAKARLEKSDFALVLLDVGLPDGEGYKLCSFMQQDDRLRGVPVVFLTGRGQVDDKVLAFSLGADDYILKPFDTRELRARILGRIAKTQARSKAGRELRKGDLRICLDTQRVYMIDGANSETLADLTGIEFKLLLHFATHVEHVLSRDQVISAVWGEGFAISDRTVDSHISKLRKKLLASRCQIAPVHGEGYRFILTRALLESA
ncbi:MAG TPA: response regulator transcription factor [Bdellovibrionota bacterium]|nr:response regulator transcription factor [Bdellovibrionota bacterium]